MSSKQNDDGKDEGSKKLDGRSAEARERALTKHDSMQDMYLSPNRQCGAMSKIHGRQCLNRAMVGSRVCRMHGGATKQAKAKAAERIRAAQNEAADLLVEFMADPESPRELRTKIAQDLLNRSGVSEKHVLQIGVEQPKSFLDFVGDAIVDVEVSDDDPNVIDAEVIEDDDRTPLVPRDEQNRHDRAVFREVERARRIAPQGDSRTRAEMIAAEEEALGVTPARPARQRTTGRSNDDAAMRSQQDREDDEVRRVREAERRLNAERNGGRRARSTEATMSQPSRRKRR